LTQRPSRGDWGIGANIADKPLKIRGEARSVGNFAAMLHASKPVDLAFEAFLKELPPEYATMAREFKACARPRKLKTPAQLLQVVMLYCGLDQALRTTAGSFTLLEE
jgi:cell fate regulator YaaT (PSP1 superfamily)